jgi:hypothetical protein
MLLVMVGSFSTAGRQRGSPRHPTRPLGDARFRRLRQGSADREVLLIVTPFSPCTALVNPL